MSKYARVAPRYYITQQGRIIANRWCMASALKAAQLWARTNHAPTQVHGPTVNGTDLLVHVSETGEVE